jgi:hypothetical protein
LEQVFLGSDNSAYDWKTEYNPDRDYQKGWYYEKNGELHWTRGQEGKFIYQKLYNKVQENISNWIFEYLNKNLDEGGKHE